MAYRYGSRMQVAMFPPSIEDYVPEDAPVRAYDAMVDAMELRGLGLEMNPYKVGYPQYDPKAMLKLLVYGYAYGVRSSRKLERETQYNVSFMWLMGGLTPDHKTIAEFRRRNKEALKKVIHDCSRICLQLGLIEGNTFFVDGSKWRANAGIDNAWTEKKCEKALAGIDGRIEEILRECEQEDEREEGQESLVKLKEALADQEALKAKVKGIVEQLREEEKSSINRTDPECTRIHGRQGSHAGYNGQIVVDEKEGLIVASDVVNTNNDLGQFSAQIEQANETVGGTCATACGDAGFADYDDLQQANEGIDVIVPSKKQAHGGPAKPFDKSAFAYDAERDVYRCPEGHELRYRTTVDENEKVYYPTGKTCRECRHFGVCTRNRKNGRQVTRYVNEDFREALSKRYKEPDAQAIYRKRKEKVELPFGHMKRNLDAGYFLLRGLAGVRAEMSLLATCFNIARMITILGVTGMIAQLRG